MAGPVIAAAMLVQLACGGSPSAPSGSQANSVVRIDVAAATGTASSVAPGGSLQLKATAIDTSGGQRDVSGSAIWQSSDPEKAVVTSSGLVKGGRDGAVEISATLSGVTGKASLVVKADMPSCAAATLSVTSASVTPFNNVVRANVTTPQSDCRWIAVSDSDWLNPGDQSTSETGTGTTLDPGRSGNGFVAFTASANRTLLARTGHVRVMFTDGAALDFTVNQGAPSCVVTLSQPDVHVPYAPTSGSFQVHAVPSSCAWTASVDPRIDPAWNLHVSGSGVGDGAVTYSANPTPTNITSIFFEISVRPSSLLDPPRVFRLYLGR